MASGKIYVAGTEIGRSIHKEDLEDKFAKFGKVASVWVARQPPGFAFVEFDDARDAEDAVQEMNGTSILGNEIRCEISRPKDRGGDVVKPGDWKCFGCGVNNFSRRFECFRCHAPKEGDRYDRRDRYDDRRYDDRRRDDRRDDDRRYDDRRYDDRRYDDRRRHDSRDRRDSRDRYDSRDRRDSRDRHDSRDRRD
jgi:splicing factor, arginine/serine-rich 7